MASIGGGGEGGAFLRVDAGGKLKKYLRLLGGGSKEVDEHVAQSGHLLPMQGALTHGQLRVL